MFTNMYGAKKLFTSVSITNHGAMSLYEKFGFVKIDTSEYEYDGKTFVEHHMVLETGSNQ